MPERRNGKVIVDALIQQRARRPQKQRRVPKFLESDPPSSYDTNPRGLIATDDDGMVATILAGLRGEGLSRKGLHRTAEEFLALSMKNRGGRDPNISVNPNVYRRVAEELLNDARAMRMKTDAK